MLPIFFKGYSREYEESDLFQTLKEHKSDTLGDQFERIWLEEVEYASKKNKKPSLLKVIAKRFGLVLFGYAVIAAILELGIK